MWNCLEGVNSKMNLLGSLLSLKSFLYYALIQLENHVFWLNLMLISLSLLRTGVLYELTMTDLISRKYLELLYSFKSFFNGACGIGSTTWMTAVPQCYQGYWFIWAGTDEIYKTQYCLIYINSYIVKTAIFSPTLSLPLLSGSEQYADNNLKISFLPSKCFGESFI